MQTDSLIVLGGNHDVFFGAMPRIIGFGNNPVAGVWGGGGGGGMGYYGRIQMVERK